MSAERVIARIDWFRGLGGLLLVLGLAVAPMVTGGAAGWAIGLAILGIVLIVSIVHLRRRRN